MSKEYKEAYDKILNILYPGYSEMSQKRKEAIEFRETGITAHATQINAIFDKMKDSEDPLYQEGASDKDIINIAAIYARIYEESHKKIASPTGKMLRGGDYGDVPEPEYEYRDRTEQEVLASIQRAVEEYKSAPKISIRNILGGIKHYEIDYNTALNVSNILKEMKAQDRGTQTKDGKEEMEK